MLNINLIYKDKFLLDWANVFCSSVSIPQPLFDYTLKIIFFLYIDKFFVSWANVLCSDVSIPRPLFDYTLKYFLSPLPRPMVCRFGQLALFRCEHPPSPILLPPIFYIIFTEVNNFKVGPMCFAQM